MAGPSAIGSFGASPDTTLDRACDALAVRGDHRGVVRLVERWAATGEPSRAALLHQCRALVELRLMDRAWVRLNELIGDAPDEPDALLLAAEMFVERGWPARAQKLLARVPPERRDALWAEQAERAQGAPLQPAANAREIEQTGSPQEQLALAERFQAAGSFLRARSILERLRRAPGPWRARVEDLLWALSGEFAKEEGDPLTLAYSLVPSLAADDGPELTESFPAGLPTVDDITGDEEDDAGPAFPSLFRRLDEPTETETASEVTAVSVMADKDELRRSLLEREDAEADDDYADFDYEDGRSGDTQIMLVMRRGGGQADAPAEGPAHRRKEESGYQLRETLNLRAYQESMGMSPVGGQEFSEEVGLEEEDDDLIVVTRRERDPAAALTDPPPEPARPVQVVERPVVVSPPPRAAPTAPTPARGVADRAPPPRRKPPPRPVDEDEDPSAGGRAGQALRLAIMAFILVLVGLGMVLALSALLGGA